jgi:hypothetical protein
MDVVAGGGVKPCALLKESVASGTVVPRITRVARNTLRFTFKPFRDVIFALLSPT